MGNIHVQLSENVWPTSTTEEIALIPGLPLSFSPSCSTVQSSPTVADLVSHTSRVRDPALTQESLMP